MHSSERQSNRSDLESLTYKLNLSARHPTQQLSWTRTLLCGKEKRGGRKRFAAAVGGFNMSTGFQSKHTARCYSFWRLGSETLKNFPHLLSHGRVPEQAHAEAECPREH